MLVCLLLSDFFRRFCLQTDTKMRAKLRLLFKRNAKSQYHRNEKQICTEIVNNNENEQE